MVWRNLPLNLPPNQCLWYFVFSSQTKREWQSGSEDLTLSVWSAAPTVQHCCGSLTVVIQLNFFLISRLLFCSLNFLFGWFPLKSPGEEDPPKNSPQILQKLGYFLRVGGPFPPCSSIENQPKRKPPWGPGGGRGSIKVHGWASFCPETAYRPMMKNYILFGSAACSCSWKDETWNGLWNSKRNPGKFQISFQMSRLKRDLSWLFWVPICILMTISGLIFTFEEQAVIPYIGVILHLSSRQPWTIGSPRRVTPSFLPLKNWTRHIHLSNCSGRWSTKVLDCVPQYDTVEQDVCFWWLTLTSVLSDSSELRSAAAGCRVTGDVWGLCQIDHGWEV